MKESLDVISSLSPRESTSSDGGRGSFTRGDGVVLGLGLVFFVFVFVSFIRIGTTRAMAAPRVYDVEAHPTTVPVHARPSNELRDMVTHWRQNVELSDDAASFAHVHDRDSPTMEGCTLCSSSPSVHRQPSNASFHDSSTVAVTDSIAFEPPKLEPLAPVHLSLVCG